MENKQQEVQRATDTSPRLNGSMCNCKSYNGFNNAHDGVEERILSAPSWSGKQNGICVDACIADAILMLWENDVVTMGCCCGHNKIPPSVIITGSDDPAEVLRLLKENDGRNWTVQRWELVDYTSNEQREARR